jgi:hypothetical protein
MAFRFAVGLSLLALVAASCSRSAGEGTNGRFVVAAEEPGPQFVGRWDTTQADAPATAWPGGRIVARFDGTAIHATLSQTNGFGGGNTWMNVIVDGAVTKKVEIKDVHQDVEVATNLAPGEHVVELEKRTEANLGTIAFEGFTLPGGGTLLSPPARSERRVEFLADSTIDGYGADGVVNGDCAGTDPPELNDVHKSMAAKLSASLGAESHILAYSGKGLVQNEAGDTGPTFPMIYGRTLPEVDGSVWDFTSWTPDVVVVSLGGSDVTTDAAPPGLQGAYDNLITSIRGRYPNAHVYMTVWSQIKDLGAGSNLRTALKTVLDAIKSAHAADDKLHVFVFNEADYPQDETGCDEHANEAHATETASEIGAAIKADVGW